uniref:Sulfotransferase n=1 Tax=Electrophorus electricus TaxID=8005 RepID=A0A4W4HGI2_ELEEL
MEGGPLSAEKTLHPFPLLELQGVPLRSYIVDNWSSISAFCPDPSDLLIATYPKAGTKWAQEMVDLLLHSRDMDICKRAPTNKRMPFLEIQPYPDLPSGLDLLKSMKPPRVIKTHLPVQLVPKGFWENKCKVIYVARNAKDNVVSYYHFERMNRYQPEPGPWEEYIHKFMKGNLGWGSWYDHVKGYWKQREKQNILYLFFEDMKEDPRREVVRIMHYLDLSLADDVIDKIVQLTSFKVMKDNPMANYTFIPQAILDYLTFHEKRRGRRLVQLFHSSSIPNV